MIEAALLVELARAVGRGRGKLPGFVAAGDEGQTVRPTDFDWGRAKDLLAERLGTPEALDLACNLRSPRDVSILVQNTRSLYTALRRELRPRGQVLAESDDATVGEVLHEVAADEDERERLRAYAGLEALGEDRFNLEGESERRVAWEKGKHRNGISTASVGRFAKEPAGPAKAMAERIWRQLHRYAERFGHEAPDRPLADHPYARAGGDGANPIDRERDIEGWEGKGPDRLEPAYARRAARIRVGGLLQRPCRLLDLFCGAPAMRFLLKDGSAYRGADVAPRFDGCETIDLRRSALPPRLDSELVTVLGALEYLDDLHGFLVALRGLGLPVLASYHTTDDTRGTERTDLGWKNHLGRQDLIDAFASAGFRSEVNWVFDGRQSLVKATPAG